MQRFAEFLALVATGLFAGAALYINLVEHPVRMARESGLALELWAPSYARATRMQASLALLGSLSAAAAAFLGGGMLWLIAAVLIGAVVPFTLLVIMPTNRALLTAPAAADPARTRALLDRWSRLHAVRTALSIAALLLMAWIVRDF